MDGMIPYLAAGISAGIWLWFIRRHDKFEPEPLKTLLGVLIFGGLASGFPAAMLNDLMTDVFPRDPMEYDLGVGANMIFCAWVGLNEEFWKALMTVALISKHKDFNEPVDGIIYAMTCALGFAAIENLFYIWEFGLSVIFTRSLLAVPIHLTCAAISGFGMARIRFGSGNGKYFKRMIPYVLAAALAHAAYDLALFEDSLGLAIAIMVVMITITRMLIKRLLNESPFKPAQG